MPSPIRGFSPEFEILAQTTPVSIMCVDSRGLIRFVNDWHLKHFGRGLREKSYFLGKSLFSLPGIVSAGVGEALKPVLQGKDVLIEKAFTPRFSGGHSGYQTLWAKGLQEGPRPDGAVIIREDVTRSVELEKYSPAELQRLQMLLNATRDSAILMDTNGEFVALNEEAARRRSKKTEELLGESIYRHLEPDAAKFRRAMAEKVLATGKPVEYDEAVGERTHRVSIYPILDGDGRITHLGSFSKDITESKQMEQALIQAKQRAEASFVAKTQFLANISHELRTPLNGILGAVQLASEDPLSEEQHELWNIVTESGERLLRAINSLLDLADIASHALQPAMRPFSLRKAVAGVVQSFATQARLKGLELVTTVAGDIPEFMAGDEFRLRQILASLVSNAVQCTPKGSVRVKVGILGDDDHMCGAIACVGATRLLFSVEDTGVGIPRERLPAIFDSFSLAEDALTKTRSGAGVGLAIARSLVELLGGRIWAESTPDVGSSFHFTASFWPLAPEDEEGSLAAGQEGNGIRVLIVEDESVNLTTASLILKRLGYRVTGATDGQEGLKALRDGSFEVVLMDIQMPVMDGITAARMIRSGELPGVDRRIPIIALTSYTTRRDRTKYLQEGMDGFVPKPFNAAMLAEAIDRVLRVRTTAS